MPATRVLKFAAGALLALGVAGCFGGAKAPPQLLTLTPEQRVEPGTQRSATTGESIVVLTPTVPRAVSANRIPVYVNATTVQYLVNSVWVEEPKELFRRVVSETIAARTGRLVIDPNNFAQPQGVTLSGQLMQFGFDPSRMEAVAVYEAESLRTQRFEARVPVTTQDVTTIAPALNQAANQLAQAVADWVGR
jgi:cholesterol transport system auxiliary component